MPWPDSAHLSLRQTDTPTQCPQYGGNLLYVKSDGRLYTKDFDGIEAPIAAPIDSPAFTGNPTAPTPTSSDNDTSIATTAFVQAAISAALTTERLAQHPVGSIEVNVSGTNPGTYIGGTWTSWGTGRVPVGVDTGQTEFNTVEKTGGEKTHVLTTAEMPAHGHVYRKPQFENVTVQSGTGNSLMWGGADVAPTTNTTGGGGAHNNLQPYITCYMWKRTA